jgi:hypothetical protein
VRLKTISGLAFCLFVFIRVSVAAPPDDVCSLPGSLQREIAAKYPGTELVTLSALDDDDKGFFQKDHGDACPGFTTVDFYGDGKPTLALILIARDDTKKKTELLVAHEVGEKWKTSILDMAAGASVPVVWKLPPGHYRDVYGKKEIRATRPVIVFTGYESWSILYAWTGSRAIKIWLQD